MESISACIFSISFSDSVAYLTLSSETAPKSDFTCSYSLYLFSSVTFCSIAVISLRMNFSCFLTVSFCLDCYNSSTSACSIDWSKYLSSTSFFSNSFWFFFHFCTSPLTLGLISLSTILSQCTACSNSNTTRFWIALSFANRLILFSNALYSSRTTAVFGLSLPSSSYKSSILSHSSLFSRTSPFFSICNLQSMALAWNALIYYSDSFIKELFNCSCELYELFAYHWEAVVLRV